MGPYLIPIFLIGLVVFFAVLYFFSLSVFGSSSIP